MALERKSLWYLSLDRRYRRGILGVAVGVRYIREAPLVFLVLAVGVYAFLYFSEALWKADDIPRVYLYDSNWFTRCFDIFRGIFHGDDLVLKGYQMYPNSFFKIRFLDRSFTIVPRPCLREFFDFPESTLSFKQATAEKFEIKYIYHENMTRDIYHTPVLRNKLTQNIGSLMDDMVDEIVHCFKKAFPLTDDWTGYKAYEGGLRIVVGTTNRIMVGLPLCRNNEYLDAVLEHSTHVVAFSTLLGFFPEFLKPLISWTFFPLRKGQKVGYKYLSPIIEERKKQRQTSNQEYKKPNDILQWLMEAAQGIETTPSYLTDRILMMNFAAIHSTSIAPPTAYTYTQALYDLAAHPEYVESLREEVESVTNTEGWKKSAITKMIKLDSFLKESSRLHHLTSIGNPRLAVKDFAFSNGVTIPKGSHVVAPVIGIHWDNTIYENAADFDGFRFARMRQQDPESGKYNMVSTGLDWLTFGTGQHACPARHFAVHEVKTMLAYTLLNYDVKCENGTRPSDLKFQQVNMPNTSAKIQFRRRQK